MCHPGPQAAGRAQQPPTAGNLVENAGLDQVGKLGGGEPGEAGDLGHGNRRVGGVPSAGLATQTVGPSHR